MNEGLSVNDEASDALSVVGNDVGCPLLLSLQCLLPEKVAFVKVPDELFLFAVGITLRYFDLLGKKHIKTTLFIRLVFL